MDRIIFRDLPGIDDIEIRYANRHRLMKDELATLNRDIAEASQALFGVQAGELIFYPGAQIDALDEQKQEEWNRHFEFLYFEFDEEEQAFWNAFDVDVTDGQGELLECLEAFGHQLVCALKRIHPHARLRFRNDVPASEEEIERDAEAWGRALLRGRP